MDQFALKHSSLEMPFSKLQALNLSANDSGFLSGDENSPFKQPKHEARVRFGNNNTYSWPIRPDDASIGDWVLNRLHIACPQRKLDKDKLIFRKRDESVINLGWDTYTLINELSDGEDYDFRIEFKNKMKHKMHTQLSRKDFPKSLDFRKVCCITVKNTTTASLLSNLKDIKYILVPFLPGESLYDALYRDGRFNNKALPSYNLIMPKRKDEIADLTNNADCYPDEEFSFVKRTKPHEHLPEVTPYKAQPEQPISTTPEKYTNTEASQQQGVEVQEKDKIEISKQSQFIRNEEAVINFTAKILLNCNVLDSSESEKVIKKIDRLCKTTYEKYAIKQKHQLYPEDHHFISNMCHSVGAIKVEYKGGNQDFIGTCFRIGSRYVMTNEHVVALVKQGYAEKVWVDFDYKESKPVYGQFLVHRPHDPLPLVSLVSSDKLDYAVLSLDVNSNPNPLPPSLTGNGMLGLPSYGTSLEEGKFLYFAGHPGEDRTATNLCCPVINPATLEKDFVITTHWLADKNFKTYDVSTFFHGSSGSPGFLPRERMLLVMHTRGVSVDKGTGRSVEQGVMISAILADISYKIKSGIIKLEFKDLFGVEPSQPYSASRGSFDHKTEPTPMLPQPSSPMEID